MQASVLITGSNRGLGFEWARQYAAAGWRVYASCRQPQQAQELQQLAHRLANVTIIQLDVTDQASINRAVQLVDRAPVDILINNAGVYYEKFDQDVLGQIDYAHWQETFNVNTLGAMRVTEALIDAIARSNRKLAVAISSHMGSIAEIERAGSYAYRSSKAALNAAMKGLSWALQPRGIGVLLLHPGWVKTRMGGSDAPLSPETSVSGMRAIIDRFTPSMSGRFIRYNDTEIPW